VRNLIAAGNHEWPDDVRASRWDPAELALHRETTPDYPDLARCWVQPEPARRLPRLAGLPIVIVVAEASYHASYDHCTSKYLQQLALATT